MIPTTEVELATVLEALVVKGVVVVVTSKTSQDVFDVDVIVADAAFVGVAVAFVVVVVSSTDVPHVLEAHPLLPLLSQSDFSSSRMKLGIVFLYVSNVSDPRLSFLKPAWRLKNPILAHLIAYD